MRISGATRVGLLAGVTAAGVATAWGISKASGEQQFPWLPAIGLGALGALGLAVSQPTTVTAAAGGSIASAASQGGRMGLGLKVALGVGASAVLAGAQILAGPNTDVTDVIGFRWP